MQAIKTFCIKVLFIGVALVLAALVEFVPKAHGFELKPDGSMVLLPQEKALLEQCAARGGSGCFIVNREVVEMYAQRVAEAAVAEVQAQVAEKFDAAVKERAKQVCSTGGPRHFSGAYPV